MLYHHIYKPSLITFVLILDHTNKKIRPLKKLQGNERTL